MAMPLNCLWDDGMYDPNDFGSPGNGDFRLSHLIPSTASKMDSRAPGDMLDEFLEPKNPSLGSYDSLNDFPEVQAIGVRTFGHSAPSALPIEEPPQNLRSGTASTNSMKELVQCAAQSDSRNVSRQEK